jgi:hypothetical protein
MGREATAQGSQNVQFMRACVRACVTAGNPHTTSRLNKNVLSGSYMYSVLSQKWNKITKTFGFKIENKCDLQSRKNRLKGCGCTIVKKLQNFT